MAKIKYENITFRGKARAMIDRANVIIEEYAAQGYALTLRQLYYQFVTRDFCPNTAREYDRLGIAISNGRRAGLIDWDAIVDRTRYIRGWGQTHDAPEFAVKDLSGSFKLDLWENQTNYVELWFEKDALLGVFERAGQSHRLPLFSNRGYVSDSSVWEAAQRILAMQDAGKECFVLHFGDHDPSGLDMTRDVEDRLNLFGASPKVKRLALNMAQVKRYNPPPNPAKESDSRFAEYRAEHGDSSWELDALSPDVMVKLVTSAIDDLVDANAWAEDFAREETHKAELALVATKWPGVVKFVNKPKRQRKKK